MRTLALGGIAGPIVFAIVMVTAAAMRPGYSHTTNLISELGATGTSNAALMNYAGFIPAGLMLAVFGAGLAATLPPRRFARAAALLVALFGIGIAAAGVFSCDPGCPQRVGSLSNRIHDGIAPPTFLSLIAGAAMLGTWFRRRPEWRDLAAYSFITSGVALACLIALAASLESRTASGLWQRLMLTVMFLWCAIVGLRAYRRSAVVRAGLLVLALTAPVAAGQDAASQRPVIVFRTEKGSIEIEIDAQRAPATAANFLKYVDGGFYDGGVVNRAVRPDNTVRRDVEIQVIQFQIDGQRRREQFPPIPLERTSATGLKHVDGAVSMARNGPDTATASFSIVIGDQPEMDFAGKRNPDGQGFAVFGRVIRGMDVVKAIQSAPTGQSGPYRTETLDPPIKVLKAYRK